MAALDCEVVPLTGAGSQFSPRPTPSALDLEDSRENTGNGGVVEWITTAWQGSGSCVKGTVAFSLAFCSLATILVIFAATAGGSATHQVSFFVIGDWGRENTLNQSRVAQLMDRKAAALHPSFVISTGDNFYPNGLNSSADALFHRSFSSVYRLQVPWYAVLGNHDYGDGFEYCENDASRPCARSPMHQLGVALTRRDWRWHCARSHTMQFGGGLLEVFFVDTSPFIADIVQNASWAKYDGGIFQQDWDAQLREVEARLAASTARWKVMVGHHPPRSNGEHGNNTEIMRHFEPLMQRHGARVYFSGHDHNLEHLHIPEMGGLNYFVSGGGSDCDRGFNTSVASQWQFPSSGFAAVKVTQQALRVSFYTLENGLKPAYTATIPATA